MSLKKKNEKVAAEAVRLQFSFEPDALVITAEGFGRFRIEAADLAMLLDPALVRRAFEDAGGMATRRVFDAPAIEKFCAIARYLEHGLSMTAIGKLLNENESDCRDFYEWCLNSPGSRGELTRPEKARLAREDVLPLVKPRESFRPGEMIEEIPINALDVKRLLERDFSRDGFDAAEILGISQGDLNAWLSKNSEMMRLLG